MSFRDTALGLQVQAIRAAARKPPTPPQERVKALDWTMAEIKRAVALRHAGFDWGAIAEKLGTGRTPRAIQERVGSQTRKTKNKMARELVEVFGADHVHADLYAATDGWHGVKDWADRHGFRPNTIQGMRQGERSVSARVARALGYELRVVYLKRKR